LGKEHHYQAVPAERAIGGARGTLGTVLERARFGERFAKEPLNARQIKVLNRVLEGFEGKLTTSRWAKLAKCSQDTAHRDILDLIKRGARGAGAAGADHELPGHTSR
jgi:Fic family protein